MICIKLPSRGAAVTQAHRVRNGVSQAELPWLLLAVSVLFFLFVGQQRVSGSRRTHTRE